MVRRFIWVVGMLFAAASGLPAVAQETGETVEWLPAGGARPGGQVELSQHQVRLADDGEASPVGAPGELPSGQGQVWRKYDIRSYTAKLPTIPKPEQALVDWILRETGTEIWFSEPVGVLSASRTTLHVYHTPEMQRLVGELVERFVRGPHDAHLFALQLVTVNSPAWRARALALMRSVPVQSPGVDAWMLSKENAAVLIAELRQRADFRERNSPHVVVPHGQSQLLTQRMPRNYARWVKPREGAAGGYELEMGQVQEGFTLKFSPLVARDGQTIDAVVECTVDQVERLIAVPLDIPALGGAAQRVDIQVPQVVSWRLHDRFRWPANQILLLSCGVVATPGQDRPTMLGLPNPFATSGARADALMFIEYIGPSTGTADPAMQAVPATASGYRARY